MWKLYVNREWIATFDDLDSAQQAAASYSEGDDYYGQFPDVELVPGEEQ